MTDAPAPTGFDALQSLSTQAASQPVVHERKLDAQGRAYCEPCGDRLVRRFAVDLSRDFSDLQARIQGKAVHSR